MLDTTSTNGATLRLGGWNGWYCFVHILQLAILDGINLDCVKPLFDAVRATVTFFKRSTNATFDLLEAQKQKSNGSNV